MAPKTTTWEIEPHTKAKHRILRKYLASWMPTMTQGPAGHGRVIFIDSFCGPGEYIGGHDGSPIIALGTYLEHHSRPAMEKAEFIFIFTDEDHRRIKYLNNVALPRLGELPRNVIVAVDQTSSAEALAEILDRVEGEGKRLAPAFAFLDPFGFSDTPMDLIRRLLRHRRSEVLVTVMLEPINRFLVHPNEKIGKQLDQLFGTDKWRDLVSTDRRLDSLSDFYARQLKESARFVWSFRMLDRRNRPKYDLFFGTNHIEGLKKMKKAMWSVDPVAGARFSDRSTEGQLTIFSPQQDTGHLRAQLLKEFRRQTVTYARLERWVLTDTMYHAGQIKRATLWPMEEAGEIEYVPPVSPARDRTRARATYPRGCSIRFL